MISADTCKAMLRGITARPRAAGLLVALFVYFAATNAAHALIPLLIFGAVGAGLAANEIFCWVTECGGGTATFSMQRECIFCGIFVQLSCQSSAYSRAIYVMFADMALALARFLFMVYLSITVMKMFVFPKEGHEHLVGIVSRCMIYFGVTALLFIGSTGTAQPLIFEWLFDLMQQLVLATAQMAISYISQETISRQLLASVPNFTGGCGSVMTGGSGALANYVNAGTPVALAYANLWNHIEIGVWPIIAVVAKRLTPDHFTPSGAISAILLAAPYVFVLIVFGVFLVQVLFYFLAVGAASPFLIGGLMFRTSQGWAMSAFRLLVGGSMTIFFSALALGFTLSLIAGALKNIGTAVAGDPGCAAAAATGVVSGLNKNLFGWLGDGISNVYNSIPGTFGAAPASPQPCASGAPVTTVQVETHGIDTVDFWKMVLIGWISVMLHLAAPRIASNVSGANDSANTAGALTSMGGLGVAKMLGGARLGTAGAISSAGGAAGGLAAWTQNRAAQFIGLFSGRGTPS
ncbi:MAG: hypothetical protein IBJ15_02065 [Alphaproteobacteria bacterium]|nr:hypothetical protein [Alphaproteobacteria bacterium]